MVEQSTLHVTLLGQRLEIALAPIRDALMRQLSPDVSEDELARRIGVAGKTLRDWMTGRQRGISQRNLLRVLGYLGLSLDDVLPPAPPAAVPVGQGLDS